MGSCWVVSGKIGGVTTLNTLKYDTDTNMGIWYINHSKYKEKRYKCDTNSIKDILLQKHLILPMFI